MPASGPLPRPAMTGCPSSPAQLMPAKKGHNKGKQVAKSDLPSKICVVCGLPFTWWAPPSQTQAQHASQYAS